MPKQLDKTELSKPAEKQPRAPKRPRESDPSAAPQVIIKEVKAKRKPTAYNTFISEHTKGGKMSFNDAIIKWREQKAATS